MAQSSKASVIVVGAGIFGVTSAIELQDRGYEVTLIERSGDSPHPAAASSDISKLIRIEYGSDSFYSEIMKEAIEGWKKWNAEWQEQLFHQTGLMSVRTDLFDPESYEQRSLDTYKKLGFKGEERIVGNSEIVKRFPAYSSIWKDAFYEPDSGWAESTRVVARLMKSAKSKGVHILQKTVLKILREGDRCIGVLTEQGALYSDWVVLAAGPWSSLIFPEIRTIMTPVGQSVFHFQVPPEQLHLFTSKNFPPCLLDIARTGFYIFPPHPSDGRIKVGNHGTGYPLLSAENRDIAELLSHVEETEEIRFRKFLAVAFPALKDAKVVGRRICIYNDTFDGDFLIDHIPKWKGLVAATGGSGHGFKFGPVYGGIVADVLEGKPNKFANRFVWRDPSAKRIVIREASRSMVSPSNRPSDGLSFVSAKL